MVTHKNRFSLVQPMGSRLWTWLISTASFRASITNCLTTSRGNFGEYNWSMLGIGSLETLGRLDVAITGGLDGCSFSCCVGAVQMQVQMVCSRCRNGRFETECGREQKKKNNNATNGPTRAVTKESVLCGRGATTTDWLTHVISVIRSCGRTDSVIRERSECCISSSL